MIFKQELSPQNGRYTPILCFHLGIYILIIVFLFWHTGINSLVPTIATNWMNVPTLLTPSQQKTVKQ